MIVKCYHLISTLSVCRWLQSSSQSWWFEVLANGRLAVAGRMWCALLMPFGAAMRSALFTMSAITGPTSMEELLVGAYCLTTYSGLAH